MSNELITWLTHKLDQLDWSHGKLARQSNVSRPLITQVLSGDVPPSADFCIKVAQALSESPEKVLRLAGKLPPLPASEDVTLQELMDLAKNLPPEQRKELLRYTRYLIQSGQDD